MKKVQHFGLAILTAMAVPLMVTPVSAQPVQSDTTTINNNATGWYGSISPRASFGYDLDLESNDFEVDNTVVDSVDISVDTDTGFGVSGAVGYQFDSARAELELGFGSNPVDGVTVGDGEEVSADGHLNNWTLAANGYYDIPTNSAFRPYVGAGVGVAKLVADGVSVELPALGDAGLDESGVSFLFQAQAGLAYDFSDDASAFVGYRLQGIPGQNFSAADVDLNADTVLIHSAQVGAQYRF
ncbi:MAG: outer membrane beta-barrel protein [Leptolyngbyaceae bacterium]|nr:outer membrane beta-barrel protein [Leptolyngbyaceae bacterium]